MRKNIAKVIEAFRVGKAARGDSKETCSTDGRVLYSHRMPIAKHLLKSKKIELIEYDRAPTRTTKSQVRAVQQAFGEYDALKGRWTYKRIVHVQQVTSSLADLRREVES